MTIEEAIILAIVVVPTVAAIAFAAIVGEPRGYRPPESCCDRRVARRTR